jgi:hypothetical protein
MSATMIDAYQRFLADGDEQAFAEAFDDVEIPRDVKFPFVHRICDLEVLGKSYRICRVVDIDARTAKLYVNPLGASIRDDTPGVPFSLEGEPLFRWVLNERDTPSKGPVDWSVYDAKLDPGK